MKNITCFIFSLFFAVGLYGQPSKYSSLSQDQSKKSLLLKLIVDGHPLEGSYLPIQASTLTVSPEIADEKSVQQSAGGSRVWVKSLLYRINGGSTIESTGGMIAIKNFNLRKGDKIKIFNVKVLRRAPDGGTVEEGENFPEINLEVK